MRSLVAPSQYAAALRCQCIEGGVLIGIRTDPPMRMAICTQHRRRGVDAVFFTPGVAAQTLLPSTLKTVSASDSYSFRGSITRPSDPLCTLRSQGRPCTTQHSVPAGCQPLPGRFNPCWVPSEVFSQVLLHMTSNSSRLCLAHFQQHRPNAGSDGNEMIACYRTVAFRSACVTLPRTIALGPVGVSVDGA